MTLGGIVLDLSAFASICAARLLVKQSPVSDIVLEPLVSQEIPVRASSGGPEEQQDYWNMLRLGDLSQGLQVHFFHLDKVFQSRACPEGAAQFPIRQILRLEEHSDRVRRHRGMRTGYGNWHPKAVGYKGAETMNRCRDRFPGIVAPTASAC